MNELKIPRSQFSKLFWDLIPPAACPTSHSTLEELEGLRAQAAYKTGSLSDRDRYEVYALSRYFKPTMVAEVGTFIGRSTFAIADGMDGGTIWTCDASNDLKLPTHQTVKIHQFPRKASTEMLLAAIAKQVKFNLFYIDGRLSQRDVALMGECMDEDGAVIVLDDFEGVEKGVSNAAMLLNEFQHYSLMYPNYGGKTAVMVSPKLIQFVPQV